MISFLLLYLKGITQSFASHHDQKITTSPFIAIILGLVIWFVYSSLKKRKKNASETQTAGKQ